MKAVIQKRSIESFFLNSANSTCLPGKKDVMKVGKEKMQKYICNDNIALLHKKYNLEHMSNQVSDTTFNRYRPKNVLPVMFSKRRVCLCKIHQNFHLRLAPLKPFGVPQSATNFLELYQTKESLESELAKLPNEDVQFRMWKQTTQMHKGKSVKRTTLFDEVESRGVPQEFSRLF